MPKSDANIKVGADTTAFSKAIDGLEKGVTEKLEKIGNVFMGALGLKAASQNIAGALSAFTAPAAELGNVATSLGVVMGNAEAAEWLTGSLQRLATNGVVPLDDLHRAARTLAGTMKDPTALARYVGVMADISAATDIPATSLARLVAGIQDLGKAELTELAKAGVSEASPEGREKQPRESTSQTQQDKHTSSAAAECNGWRVKPAVKERPG